MMLEEEGYDSPDANSLHETVSASMEKGDSKAVNDLTYLRLCPDKGPSNWSVNALPYACLEFP